MTDQVIVEELVRLRKIAEHAKKMSAALLKVLPLGGSELFVSVGGEYFADPQYCGACIDKLRNDLHEQRVLTEKYRRAAATVADD